ncbi:hypothetical protein BDF21DRAFT_463746 [Thamnidium elegans]|uniref:Uncharacterized protein n=1 Tax=Thamnidium elegans TaxID=101142 RepID=A0A8H7SW18_9FUNG|nr:hypothetical protein INT48_009543 [Thamnidium elegans]KAI8078519.1 hypothetical protein BDF21DRAFT_463746 [Thamnidium elegans]
MRFTSLLATAACVLSVNAASLTKRNVSDQVQLCRDDIDAISVQITGVTNVLSAFTSAGGYAGALTIHTNEQTLEAGLKKAGVDCCAVSGKVTDEEADAMLTTVTPVIPQATSALSLSVTKKPELDAVLLVNAVAKTDLKNLNEQTVVLYTCIRDIGSEQHPTYIPTINSFISQLDNSFAISRAAYENATQTGTA